MPTSHFEDFLNDATAPNTDSTMGPDCLYGLYVSWCLIHSLEPAADISFRAAMHRCGIDVHNSGLRMTQPTTSSPATPPPPDADRLPRG
jgi:hypothetical protein